MRFKEFDAYVLPDLKESEDIDLEQVTSCPYCHKTLLTELTFAFLDEENTLAYSLIYCPNCYQYFFCTYKYDNISDRYMLDATYPPNIFSIQISDEIKKISPNFVEIFSQAQTAEKANLTWITGIAYRKALEFLVKDYVISIYPDKAEEIMKEALSATIKRIDSTKIQTLAKKASWIGNDETHYLKKHKDLDLNTMKSFIKAMLTYIEAEKAYEEALNIEPIK